MYQKSLKNMNSVELSELSFIRQGDQTTHQYTIDFLSDIWRLSRKNINTGVTKLHDLSMEQFNQTVFTIHTGNSQTDYDGKELVEFLNKNGQFDQVDIRFLEKADLSKVDKLNVANVHSIVFNGKTGKYERFSFKDVIDRFSPKNSPEEQVNHPAHYNTGQKEVIEVLKDVLTPEEFIGGLKFNIFKYLMRYKAKAGSVDLDKAKWYQEYLKNHEYPK